MRQLLLYIFISFILVNVNANDTVSIAKLDSLYNVAAIDLTTGNYKKSLSVATELADMIERIYGKEHHYYARTLNLLAMSHHSMGNYTDAIRLGTEATDILKRTLGNHPEYAASLNNLASFYAKSENYATAVKLEAKAVDIYRRTVGYDRINYVKSLNNLADYNLAIGNYDEAARLGSEVAMIVEQVRGKKHPDYAAALNNLAICHSHLGNYAEAIHLGTEAADIRGRLQGKEHSDYGESLTNLAICHSYLGNYAEALRLGAEAVNITARAQGKEHPDYARATSNFAICHSNLGNYAEAARLETEAANIRESALGKENPDYMKSIGNLAAYYAKMGNFAEAMRFGTDAANITKLVFGKGHPNYAVSLCNLATYNSALGYYGESVRLAKEAADIAENLLEKKHPDVIHIKRTLLYSSLRNNELSDVERLVAEISEGNRDFIRGNFANLTSRERSLFWEKNKRWYEQEINFYAFRMPTESNVANAYDAALMSKGILLNSDIEMSRLLLESGDEEAVGLYNDLKNTRLMLQRLQEKPIAERYMDTDSLEKVADSMERELIGRSKAFGDYTRNMAIGWEDVRKQLKPKDMAVEFASFAADNDSVMYVAYILRPDMKAPRMVPLFEERELEKMQPSDYYRTTALSSLVWGRLDEYLKGVENIYFAPAGELYNIGIESLPAYDGDGMMSDRFKMYRLSSTRELAVVKDENKIDRAALYGGLKYDTEVTVLEEDAARHPLPATRDFSLAALTDSLGLRSGVAELPATKVEVEDINASLGHTAIKPDLYIGFDGTEGAFKEMSGKRVGLLHIATHGFYWTEKEARRSLSRGLLMGDSDSRRYIEDKALTRSGLLLTGANNALMGRTLPDNVNDGILTAKEIADIDLRGLDMVVLSACQTGLGDITGEGVFGLQRGFKKAGANSLLMSLWKVDDRATQMLMTKFYEHFLAGKSKLESLSLAQKYLREFEEEVDITLDDEDADSNMTASQRRKSERMNDTPSTAHTTKTKTTPYSDPKYWAAFILLDALN